MRKLILIVVLALFIGLPVNVYADHGATENVIVNGRQFSPDWYKTYGYESDPRIDNPDWNLDEVGEWRNDIDIGYGFKDDGTTYRLSDGIPGQGMIENPAEYWEENGYPDNISFAFEGGGMLEDEINYSFWIIGVINEAYRQEIIDLFTPNCLITFKDCTYSYNERKIAYDGILAMEDENILDVIFIKNTEEILVVVSEENFDRYTDLFPVQFGGMVRVSDGSDIGSDSQAGGDFQIGGVEPAHENSRVLWFTAAGIIALIGLATLVFIRTRINSPAMQANNGEIITVSGKAGKKQVEAAVQNSARTPPDEVFDSIIKKLENHKNSK